jgi:tetratricopeptide (TPR) repeat protein
VAGFETLRAHDAIISAEFRTELTQIADEFRQTGDQPMTSTTPASVIVSTVLERYRLLIFALSLVAIASSGCSKQRDSKEAHLSRANDYFAAEQYGNAEKEYRDVLRFAPPDPVALRQLGIIYQDQGQLPQAYPLLKKSAELLPDDLEVQFRLGEIFLLLRDYKQARDAASRILEKQPGHEKALVLLADATADAEGIEETRKLIENLREHDRDRPGYHLALGALALRQKDPARAESEFKSALSLDAKSSMAYSALGTFYWSRNDLNAANQALKTAADLAPERSPMRLRYADFLLKTGAVAEAKKILDGMTRKFSDYLPPRVFLMKIACAEHPDEDCAARVQNVLAQDPANPDAVFQDGVLSLAKGDAAKAIRDFGYMSTTYYSQNPQVRYLLARAYLLTTKSANPVDTRKAFESAEINLSEAVKLNPHFEQAILLLSEIKIRKGTPTAAVDLLAPLVKESPQIAQAQYLLASAYVAEQKGDQALAVYRQMTELFPKDPQPPFLTGIILLAEQQQLEARKAFEQSAEISPDFLPAVEKLVDLDIADKQYAPAMDRVQKQIDKNPKQAPAWALRGKIYLAQRDFAHGEADLLKSIELDPKLEPSYRLLTQLYVATNRQQQAIEKLTAFVKNNNDVPALMQLAVIQQNQKHFAEARDAYEKLLTAAPNFVAALNNLAVLYSEDLGQLDKAYDLAKRAREAAPNEPHTADTLGWVLFKRGEYRNALPLLRESEAKLPDQPSIQYHLAMAHYMLGEEVPARIALKKAADANTDFSEKNEARQRLALLTIDSRTADAGVRTELANYLKDKPNDPEALLRLAQVQEQDGVVDQAVKTYEKIVDGNPLFAPATRRLAILYSQRLPNERKTYDLITKVREAYPDDPEIAKALGILNYRRSNSPQFAVELLKEAAAKRNDDPEIFYYLGRSYHELKQWDECKGALERAVSLDLPPNLATEAKSTLADCSDPRRLALLYSQRSPDDPKAFELATQARKTYPDDPEIAKTLGILDYRRGTYPQAAELLKEAAINGKDDPELLYYLGQTYHQLKQRDECKVALERALSLNLSPNLVDAAKSALSDCSETPPT